MEDDPQCEPFSCSDAACPVSHLGAGEPTGARDGADRVRERDPLTLLEAHGFRSDLHPRAGLADQELAPGEVAP